jgi:transposase-like protein
MAGRKIVNEQDARRCLAAAGSSQGGAAAWARAHGVDGRSLHAWRMNLERRGRTRPRAVPPRLVELVPVPAASLAMARAPYVLRVGGVELEVGVGFDEQSLRRLVGLLKSC